MSATVMQTLSIAPAAASDCRECARLLVEQLGEHGVDASTEQLSRVLQRVVADGARGFILLARDDLRIVGVAYVATILSAQHRSLVAWLEELYVTPSLRSLGIGTALVTAILERARQMDIAAIDLEIDAVHSRAESLYRRFGFRRLDRSRWVRELTTRCHLRCSHPPEA
jgi:GNAT superfamily N-acetyltransferase